MNPRRTAYALVILLCIFAVAIPLPFGCMRFFWRHLFEASVFFFGAGVLLLEFFGRLPRAGDRDHIWRRRAELAFVLFLLWNAVLMIPLSRGLFSALFAHRAAVKGLDLTSGRFASAVSFGFWEGERELIVWTCAFLLFFVTSRLLLSRRAMWMLLIALALAATFEAMYGIYEYATGHQHIWGVAKRFYTGCATGTFVSRNHYAAYLMISLVVMWAAAVYLWRRDRSGDKPKALVLALWSVFVGTAMVASGARGELVGALVAVLGFHLMLSARDGGGLRPLYLALILIAGVVGMAIWVGWEPLVSRMSEAGLREAGGRPIAWLAALKMVREFGLLGVGLGSFGELYFRYRPAGAGLPFDHAHNDYLELLAECGVAGFALLLAVLAFALLYWFDRFRERRSRFARSMGLACGMALVGILLDALVNFPFRNPAVLWHLAVVLGLGASALERRERSSADAVAPGGGGWPRFLAVALLVLLGLNSIRLAYGQRLLDRYRSLQRSSSARATVERYGERRRLLSAALAKVPEDFRLHYELAKLLHRRAASGEGELYAEAVEQYERALDSQTHSCRARMWGAVALMRCRELGRCRDAGDEGRWFEAALDCCPSCADVNAVALEFAVARRNFEFARRLIGRAVADSTSVIPRVVDALWSRLGSVRAESLVLDSVPKDPVVYELFAYELFLRNRMLSAERFWRLAKSLEGVDASELSLIGSVRNGGFEKPIGEDLFGWQLCGRSGVNVERVSSGCREGVFCLKLTFSDFVRNYYQLVQDVALAAGRYELEAWIMVEGADEDESLGLELISLEAPDKPVVQLFADPSRSGWQKVSRSFVVRDSFVRLRLRARRIAPKSAGDAVLWLDGVRITEIGP